MLKKYIKGVFSSLPFLRCCKLNLFTCLLTLIFFFLPAILRKYYIVNNLQGIIIKITFLFLFEASIIPISIGVIELKNKKYCNFFSILKISYSKILNILLFAFTKTFLLILFFYLFKIVIKVNLKLSFCFCFLYFFLFFLTFYFSSIIAKYKINFFNAIFISASFFIKYPFFTSIVFLHSLVLLFVSFFFFNLYPGFAKIFFNINLAHDIIEENLLKM